MYVLRMRLCNDMVYSYVDCLSERALVLEMENLFFIQKQFRPQNS